MSFNFPSRFLKKLEIYQQIRNGQGISKHKKLWKYEAAFLKTAYGPSHQHLNSPVSLKQFKEWICKGDSEYEGREYQEILGNLFWRGYIRIVSVEKESEEVRILPDDEAAALKNKKLAHSSDNKKFEHKFLLTEKGIFIGEVVSEIENKNIILRWWNKYKYGLIIDLFWLLIFTGIANIFFKDKFDNFIKILKETSIPVCNFDLGHNILIAFLIFVFWPFLCWLYREIYLAIENKHESL